MKKRMLYGSIALITAAIVYFALQPKPQYLTIEGRLFSLNCYYESIRDLPRNWYPVSTYMYEPKGEFYFTTDEKFTSTNDSLCRKFTCVIYVDDGYLKRIFLILKNDYQRLFLGSKDSLYTLLVTPDFKPVILSQRNGQDIYLNNGQSGSVEVTTEKPD